jgi:hypothetical protein
VPLESLAGAGRLARGDLAAPAGCLARCRRSTRTWACGAGARLVIAVRFLPSRSERRSPLPAAEPAPESVDTLVALAYELLDAHGDTARLTEEDASAAEWQDHLAYLRDLQRVGREVLARAVCLGEGAPASGPTGSAVGARARRG